MGNCSAQKVHRFGLADGARSLLFLASIFGPVETADAKQCAIALPSSPQGHWSYRLIDGRKCWYEGENNFPKSLLQWPEQTPALSAFDKEMPSAKEAVPAGELSNQSRPDGCCKSPVKDSESFEARWSALETTR
jgi:hypothetical protein